jgi:hypothetical protein
MSREIVASHVRSLLSSMGKSRPDFRSNKQKREAVKVAVSVPSAGYSHSFGYSGQSLRQVDFSLKLKPSLGISSGPTTTSPILDFAVGDTSYEECFGKHPILPIKEEDPKSVQAGITTNKKERNLNSVSNSFKGGVDADESQDAPILRWREQYRDLFLDESLGLRGRGRLWLQDGLCVLCSDKKRGKAEFCCKDCFGNYPICHPCALREHEYKPLHILEVSCLMFIRFER